jgi:hypothetical protein
VGRETFGDGEGGLVYDEGADCLERGGGLAASGIGGLGLERGFGWELSDWQKQGGGVGEERGVGVAPGGFGASFGVGWGMYFLPVGCCGLGVVGWLEFGGHGDVFLSISIH